MSENKCGNFSLISDSLSHVSSSIRELLHNTLTKGTLLFLNNFSSWSKILTGLVFMVRSPLISIGTCGNTCEGSILAFRSNDTWNTLWILSKYTGNSNRYATGPILSLISKGPIYLGANFPFTPNRMMPFQGATFKNTLSPTWNSNGLLRRYA